MTDDASEKAVGPLAIGIDVGGSGIKAAVVDVDCGCLTSERLRVPTPVPSTPEAVIASIARLVRRLVKSQGLDETIPVGIGLPGVTLDGTLKFAGNIDQAWIDFPVVERLTKVLKRPIFIINDADAAGIAEMRFGVGKGRPGKVIFLTLGTGVGSGVFIDGVLVPNTEFGQMEIRGRAGRAAVRGCRARPPRPVVEGVGDADLDEHLERIQQLMWPNLLILGGGVSKSADKYIPRLTVNCEVVAGRAAQRRGDHRGGDRGSREPASMPSDDASTATQPARSTREAKT